MANNQNGGSQKPPSNESRPGKVNNQPSGETNQPLKPATAADKNKLAPSGRVMTQRQLTRYEKDRRRQRQLTISAIAIIGVLVLILIIGFFQSVIAPNIKELATVNGQSVTSGDYYKYRKLTLFKRVAQYNQMLGSLAGDQQTQVQNLIQQYLSEIDNPQAYPVDQDTLESYVSNLVAQKAAKDEFGINPSNDDVKHSLDTQFGTELQLYTPTPNAQGAAATPTMAAIETAIAAQVTATEKAITPLPTPTPSVSPSPSPVSTTASSPITPTTAPVSPTAAPTATPVPGDKAQQTVSTSQNTFFDSLKKSTGLSQDDYLNLEAKPRLIMDLVSQKLIEKLPKVGDPVQQYRASVIASGQQVEAVEILRQLKAASAADLPALFTKLAREKSTDTVSAAKNGDLGWFIQYQVSPSATEDPIWDAAVKLQPGQLSDPVNTGSTWDILYLTGKDEKRPLEESQYKSLLDTDSTGSSKVYARWLKDKNKAANPSYKTSPTPTTEPTQVPAAPFTPVIQPTPTEVPPTTSSSQPANTAVIGPVFGSVAPAATTTKAAGTP